MSRRNVPVLIRFCANCSSKSISSLLAMERRFENLFVESALLNEFFVRAARDDSPFLQNQNLIRVSDCRKSLRNDESGPSFAQAADCLLDQVFGLRVDAGSGVIEDQDPRLHQEGT